MEQKTAVLNLVLLELEKTTRDLQTLQKQLAGKDFVRTAFLEEIEGAVKVSVILFKSSSEKKRIEGTLLRREIGDFF